MKVAPDNKCTLCRGVIDYSEHFFYECVPVREFWNKINRYIQNTVGIKTELSMLDVLFGFQKHDTDKDTINSINKVILVAKMCISIFNKTKTTTPLFLIFENQMSLRKA